MKNFNTVEKYLKRLKLIRIKNFNEEIPKNITRFIELFINEYNNNHYTEYVSSKNIVCSMERRRSFQDIVSLCRYYYPNASIKKIVTALLKAKIRGCFTCGTINKYVFTYSMYPHMIRKMDDYLTYDKNSISHIKLSDVAKDLNIHL